MRNSKPTAAVAIASSSLITEWVKGKSLDDALAIKNSEIAEELELPPVKIHCSILAEDAVKAVDCRLPQTSGKQIKPFRRHRPTMPSEPPAALIRPGRYNKEEI